ncbi:unnamed protein product [Lathyrus sativus]|nr:unnamed protein product [Lathyrus sativus]
MALGYEYHGRHAMCSYSTKFVNVQQLISAYGSSGNWKEAHNVCKKMTDNKVGPDLVTHDIMLSAFKSRARYSKALSYFELMKGTHIRPDTSFTLPLPFQ